LSRPHWRLIGTTNELAGNRHRSANFVRRSKRSTELVHALLTNDLVDAMTMFTVPVVLGGGKSCPREIARQERMKRDD